MDREKLHCNKDTFAALAMGKQPSKTQTRGTDMSAGELMRNHPETFWAIHKGGRFAEQQASKKAAKARNKPPVIKVKIRDTEKASNRKATQSQGDT